MTSCRSPALPIVGRNLGGRIFGQADRSYKRKGISKSQKMVAKVLKTVDRGEGGTL